MTHAEREARIVEEFFEKFTARLPNGELTFGKFTPMGVYDIKPNQIIDFLLLKRREQAKEIIGEIRPGYIYKRDIQQLSIKYLGDDNERNKIQGVVEYSKSDVV